jgi:uncharacterized RDD family membrane protein YckC
MEYPVRRGMVNEDAYELATMGARLGAGIIDWAIVFIVGGILIGRMGNAGGGMMLVLGLAYHWYFWTQQDGQTLGKRVMNIRVIRKDALPLTAGDAFLRYLGYYLGSLFFGIGFLWALFDDKSQGLHDKMANTYVVRA